MSVHNRFPIEIYRFTLSLRTILACAAHGAIAMKDSDVLLLED